MTVVERFVTLFSAYTKNGVGQTLFASIDEQSEPDLRDFMGRQSLNWP